MLSYNVRQHEKGCFVINFTSFIFLLALAFLFVFFMLAISFPRNDKFCNAINYGGGKMQTKHLISRKFYCYFSVSTSERLSSAVNEFAHKEKEKPYFSYRLLRNLCTPYVLCQCMWTLSSDKNNKGWLCG